MLSESHQIMILATGIVGLAIPNCDHSFRLSTCWFESKALSVGFWFCPICYFISLYWAIFWIWNQVQKLFPTYVHRLLTLILKVHPYLFVYNSAQFGTFWALFRAWLAILEVPIRLKHFFWTCLHRLVTFIQLWFWKYSPIFVFLIFPHLGDVIGSAELLLRLQSESKMFWVC